LTSLRRQRSQVALMQQSFPDVKVITVGQHEAMTFDCWAALWSLPAALGITLANLPAPSRFLQTRAEDVARWRERLAAVAAEGQTRPSPAADSSAVRGEPVEPRALRIGLVWQGQFAGQDNQMAERSIPPRLMQRLVEAHPSTSGYRCNTAHHHSPPRR
jgi:hypothetical protein